MNGEELFEKMSLIDDELIEAAERIKPDKAENTETKNTETKNTELKNTETKNAEAKNTEIKNAEAKNTETQKTEVKKAKTQKNKTQKAVAIKTETKKTELKKQENKDKKRKQPNWKIWGSLVACICLLFISDRVAEQWLKQKLNHTSNDTQKDSISDEETTGSISVPAIQLPEGNDTAQYEMIGLIVYQGRIYTQVERYEGDKATAIRGLVGERLGFAKGNIDEWSKQEDYAEEFAATAYGDVYAVNGYSTDFRICIYEQYSTSDNSQEMVDSITFFENLNGISLATGADLFEEYLKVQENWKTVQYQTHDSWDYALGKYHDLVGITDTDLDEFLTELNASEFVDMTSTDIYDWTDQRQTHVYINLKDGTLIELRLIEGGYVGYQGLGWYFVKMPGSAFDSVFEACFQEN